VAGKLKCQCEINAVRHSPLVYITDQLSGVQFLADSGASVSLIPGNVSTESSIPLESVNGGKILNFGEKAVDIQFKHSWGTDNFQYDFLVGQVSVPILGADFLDRHQLMVDVAGGRLISMIGGKAYPCQLSFTPSTPSVSAVIPDRVYHLLGKFSSVLNQSSKMPTTVYGVQHHMITTGPPVCSRFRRLDGEKLADAKRIFGEWEEAA